jgi:hypothetical protein
VVKQKLQDIEGVKIRLQEQYRQLKQAIQQTKKHAAKLIETLNKGYGGPSSRHSIDTPC